MITKKCILWLFVVALALSLGVCSKSGGQQDSGQKKLSYEEFLSLVKKEPGPDGVYIVEGDYPINDENALKEYYYRYFTGQNQSKSKSTVDVDAYGNRNSWGHGIRKNLTYCVSTAFGPRYADVVSAIDSAAMEWEGTVGGEFNFSHEATSDSACDCNNTSVVFNVVPTADNLYLARAFAPNAPRARRELRIDNSAFTTPPAGMSLIGLMRHELGHALGLRHEYQRLENSTCVWEGFSNAEPLTPYDAGSVMRYPNCDTAGIWNFQITLFDQNGIRCLYLNECPFSSTDIYSGRTIYIKADSTCPNPDGSSWDRAFKSLSGIKTYPNDELWIARGTYDSLSHTADSSGGARNIYGGFAGTETSADQRSVAANPTIISGDLGLCISGAKPCVIDGLTVSGDPARRREILISDANNVSIRNCAFDDFAGSLENIRVVFSTGVTVANCTVKGGINIYSSDSCVVNGCTLTQSSKVGITTGFSSNVMITNCSLKGNTNTPCEFWNSKEITVDSCRFEDNATSGSANAGILNFSSDLAINYSFFYRNSSSRAGAALVNRGGKATVLNCDFKSNSAPMVSNETYSNCSILGSIFACTFMDRQDPMPLAPTDFGWYSAVMGLIYNDPGSVLSLWTAVPGQVKYYSNPCQIPGTSTYRSGCCQ